MDVQQKLDEIVAAVDSAKSMPMSASCVLNRAELLAKLDEVRQALPGSLAEAEQVLGGTEQMVADAQGEAQRIIETAHAERGSMVSGTEVARQAQEEADRILAEARREAEEVRAEADDYVDDKLANFEVVLSKTVGSVERGREKLLGSGPGSEEWNEQYAEDAPERSTDPDELRRRADGYVDARLGSVAAVLSKTLEAVGRGREKLVGHQPSDELGAHMAVQDESDQAPHTSDADYYADLAAVGQAPEQHPDPQQLPQQPQQPDHPGYEPVAATTDPYATQVPQPAGYDAGYGPNYEADYGAYYAQQDPYAAYQQHQQQYAYYDQQDPYAAYQHQQLQEQQLLQAQQFAQHEQQLQQQQYYYGQPQPQFQPLDETSLFDTGMMDLDQVRQYEQQYGYGG